MSNVQGTVAGEERLRWLIDQLGADGFVTIAAAAEVLGVSEMTIRRDLIELEERGIARRVRGGAKTIAPLSFAERHDVAARAKSRIAAKLADLVPASGAVAFDASSTVMRLAAALGAARNLTVLTNGPDTFTALQGLAAVSPILTGGELEPSTGSLVGPVACRTATQFAVQTFFASAAAIDETSGALEMNLDEAEVKRSIAANAGEVVLAVDSSKLGGSAFAVGLEWDQIDILVTELDRDDARLQPYRDLAQLL